MFEVLMPLAGYVFVTTITPGPNNLMLAASGREFGYTRTLPHLAGVALGFTSLLALCALGLGKALAASPALTLFLKAFASAYLVYLLAKIVRRPAANKDTDGRPLSTAQAALFQVVNPKAWMMAVSSVALISEHSQSVLWSVAVLCSTFLTVGIACNHVWLLSGMGAQRLLSTRRGGYYFNLILGALTVYAVASLWST